MAGISSRRQCVDAYSETDLLVDPNNVLNRLPEVVSQFVVYPNRTTVDGSDNTTDIDF